MTDFKPPQFPSSLAFLFKPTRYKAAYGGRGSGKSWGFARALLILGVQSPIRVLCCREIQKSIKESVHKLLADQISRMGLGAYYQVMESEIRGKNGTEFYFSGLGNQTVESIKSFEGVQYCWIEEAQRLSEKSWSILVPTIRKDGSEIWATFNPELETDPTYQRLVALPPPDSKIVKMNYSENPWFNDVMEQERLHCLKTNPRGYRNIWEGECRPAVEGAIYHDEVQNMESQNRICNVPHDPMLKTHIVFDLGWNDAMAISLVQKHSSEIRIIEYIEDSHKTLAEYSAMLKERRHNWGKVFLPHDGRAKDYKTGQSAEQIMKALGWQVEITANMSIEDGIRLARMFFSRVYIDQHNAKRLVECLKRYRRKIVQGTEEPGRPLHDEFCHGADNFRYTAVNAEQMRNEDEILPIIPGYTPLNSEIGY